MPDKIQCIIVDDERVAREILEQHLSKISRMEVVASCKNVPEAFDVMNSKEVDLIFLDINLPEVSGLSFARTINQQVKVIFTTAYREYAVDGFNLQAVDYLLKPISFERLMQAINKFLNEKNTPTQRIQEAIEPEKNDYIFVRADRKMVKINFSDILFVESLSDYVKIHLREKHIVTRETIGSFEARLPRQDFVRSHRSYLVALAHIDAFTHEDLHVGTHEIPISRSYKKEVLERLEQRS